jgi:tripartite-type tricarboxylate transporter receptor subunit TctC
MQTATLAAEQNSYPTRPVRLIVPFPPGGGNDVIARMIATQLSPRLGKHVVVDNLGGGGGVLGTSIAAQAVPDGYTLLLVSATYTVTPWLYRLPYDPEKAFTPVALIASSPNLLTVTAALPASSVKDLISLAKSQPGGLRYASGGVGSNPHLSAALFGSLTKTKLAHVPFRGTGPMVVSVVSGETQMCFGPIVALLPHVRANRLKALGTGGSVRSALLPQMPTIAEGGVPGYESSNWWGIVAP